MKKLCTYFLLLILCFTTCFAVSAEEAAAEIDGWIVDFRSQDSFDALGMTDFNNAAAYYDEENECAMIYFTGDYSDPQIVIQFQESFISADYPYMQICAVNPTSERVWQFFPFTNNVASASGTFVFSSDSRTLYRQKLEDGFKTDVWSLTTGSNDAGRISGWDEDKKITGMRFDVLNQPGGEGPVYIKYIAFFKTKEDAEAYDGTQRLNSLAGLSLEDGTNTTDPTNAATPEATDPLTETTPEPTATPVPTAKPTAKPTAAPSPSPEPAGTENAGLSTPLLITIIFVAVVLIAGVIVIVLIIRKNKKQ